MEITFRNRTLSALVEGFEQVSERDLIKSVNAEAQRSVQPDFDVSKLLKSTNPSPSKSLAEAYAKPPSNFSLFPVPERESCLDASVNVVTSKLIGDDKTRKVVNHYTGEFAKTVALFTKGKAGVIGTVALYGLAQASPEDSLKDKAVDFTLGAAKGGTIKGLFTLAGENMKYAPTKGMVMGASARGAENLFQRDLLTDPLKALERTTNQMKDPDALAFDAIVWGLGEGTFQLGNKALGNALTQNKYVAATAMGGTFGMISGGTGEIMREKQQKEQIDFFKVLKAGAVRGTLDAAAGVAGTKLSEYTFKQSLEPKTVTINGEKIQTKEFVLTEGREVLEAFRRKDVQSALLRVSEVNGKPGDAKTLFVQRLAAADSTLLEGAKKADIVASCNPEQLTPTERAKHIFPEAKGRVWLADGKGDNILLSTGEFPVSLWKSKGYSNAIKLDHGQTTINVMAPLLVGDPNDMTKPESKAAWEVFQRELIAAKNYGVDGVSTDVWWGVVEPTKGNYNFSYYDKMSDHITKTGLKWQPIMSIHQCGGNVGDNVNVPVPEWVWKKVAKEMPQGDERAAMYVSEQNRASKEYVSAWATKHVVQDYADLMKAFQGHFADKAPHISEINISLGPAGEMRYPSYNSHDSNTGWPTRGGLQAYSELAKSSFREFALNKYGGIEGVQKAWELPGLDANKILPPSNGNDFFARNHHFELQYGRDFFDWYNQSLINHGKTVMGTALDVFGAKDAPFRGIDLGAKIPGIHWRVGEIKNGQYVPGDRLAELTAGLIRTSGNDWNSDAAGRGYRPILGMFTELTPPGTLGCRTVPTFTAMEMPDGADGPDVKSLPHTLSKWVGQEAQRQGLKLHGENALAGNIGNAQSWDLTRSLLDLPNQPGYFSAVTLLRMGDVVNNPVARAKLAEIMSAIRSVSQVRKKAS